jgi:DNA-binding transcriptional LysR family regulator
MNLKQFEAFVKVADTKNFSKAAAELFLSQPTVSVHISALEKEVGSSLFIRTTKEVELSEVGKEFYGYARQIIELHSIMVEKFCKTNESTKQAISIAASTIPSQYLLPKAIATFAKKYPNEQFQVHEGDSEKVIQEVIERLADIAFVGTITDRKHCVYTPFYQDELVIVTPNEGKYKEIKSEEEILAILATETYVLREEGSGTRKEALKQLKKAGIRADSMRIVASIENQEMIKSSIRQGLGISILSKLAVKEEVEKGNLLAFNIPKTKSAREMYMVYNKNYPLSRSAKKFFEVVKDIYNIE